MPDKNSRQLAKWIRNAVSILEESPGDYLYITDVISLLCKTASFDEVGRWRDLLLTECRLGDLPYKPFDKGLSINPYYLCDNEILWQMIKLHRDDVQYFLKGYSQDDLPIKKWFATGNKKKSTKKIDGSEQVHGNTIRGIKLKRQVADAAIYILKETDIFNGSKFTATSIAEEIQNNRHIFIKKCGWPEADVNNVTKRPSLSKIRSYIGEFVPNKELIHATSADEAAELIIKGKKLYNVLPK